MPPSIQVSQRVTIRSFTVDEVNAIAEALGLVPVTVTLTASADSGAVEPKSTIWLSYVSPDGQLFDEFVNPLADALESQPELYPEASATGTLAFEIPEDATGGLWAVQDGMQTIDPVFVTAE